MNDGQYVSFVKTTDNYLALKIKENLNKKIGKAGGQAVLGRQGSLTTPWLPERHGYDPTYNFSNFEFIN